MCLIAIFYINDTQVYVLVTFGFNTSTLINNNKKKNYMQMGTCRERILQIYEFN